MSIKYYLGNLGLKKSSEQAMSLRKILLSDKQEKEIIRAFRAFILSQVELTTDTIEMINKSLMTQMGSEYLGLGGDDYLFKSDLYKQFIERFPHAFGLKFCYVDCCCLAGMHTIEEMYPLLREAMLEDEENVYYPSTDVFDLIRKSRFSFEFDMLLLDKYYQPCERSVFEEYINDFKELYKGDKEQDILNGIIWKDKK